jgi:hypothetical protein
MKKLCLAIVALALVAGACATIKSGPSPEWLSAKPAADEANFYGYGCAEAKIGNWTFKRQTADERARVALAQNVHDELMKTINDEQLVRQAVEQALPQFTIVERYQDQDGNLCSRARLARADVDLAAYAALHPAPTHGG